MFLVEEWQRLVDRFEGDYDKATRAHFSLCRDWEQIWDVDALNQTEGEEQRISQLSDEELLDEWRRAEIESSWADLIAGEMERRNLDD
jgi:diadenosine tetraphosphatase ApaH/serine/threonine PP2A family protein phosphatase